VNDAIAAMRAVVVDVGFDVKRLAPFFIDRMRLLATSSETATDGTRMARFAQRVFAHYDAANEDRPWTTLERSTVVLGCLFSDVGKTGPLHAPVEGQKLVAEMFSVEGVKDETQTVAAFLATHFPADARRRVTLFRALGLDPSMSMRAFWNLHASWTLELTEAGGVPKEAVAAAATHHFLDDINPRGVVCADGSFSKPFGQNVAFDRAEKLVIVLDKYDAARRRGACTHEGAINWLRRWADKRVAFREDAELSSIIDAVSDGLAGAASQDGAA
jgi:hypothetical protein